MIQYRETNYFITEDGKIWSNITNKFLTPVFVNGYHRVTFQGKFYSVHRIVAEVYCCGFDIRLQVNHKDGNKLNNHFTNLEWVTPSENIIHTNNNNLINHARGIRIKSARVTESQVVEIRELYKIGNLTYEQVAEKYNIGKVTVFDIVKRKTWKHVE